MARYKHYRSRAVLMLPYARTKEEANKLLNYMWRHGSPSLELVKVVVDKIKSF